MTQQITVTRALATSKALSEKIERAIARLKLYATAEGQGALKRINGFREGVKEEEVTEAMKRDYQSVQDMITQRAALKAAVVASNAVTKVTIAGKEMTVAEAIEHKTTIGFKVQLLDQLRKQHLLLTTEVRSQRASFEEKLVKAEENLYGRDKKVTDDERKVATNPVYARSEPTSLDPIKLEEEIRNLEKEIEDFRSEVDFVLSESNAKTLVNA